MHLLHPRSRAKGSSSPSAQVIATLATMHRNSNVVELTGCAAAVGNA